MLNKSLKLFPDVLGFWIGIVGFIIGISCPLSSDIPPAAQRMLSVAFLMVCWWISEAIPLGITALIPLVGYPLLKIMPTSQVAPNYTDHLIFLFLGGFLLSIAIQEWQLHRRFALFTLSILGNNPRKILLAMMLSTALLSMWLSNTATVMMMLPICLALIQQLEDEIFKNEKKFFLYGAVLLLGISYSSSIGGIATPVGTPPNIIFIGIFSKFFPDSTSLSFLDWMIYMVPLSMIILLIVWLYLAFLILKSKHLPTAQPRADFQEKYKQLGPLTYPQKWVLAIFAMTATLWIFRSKIDLGFLIFPGWPKLLGLSTDIQDSTIAIGMAIVLFILRVPTPEGRVPLLKIKHIYQIPWDVLLLFGGGFALAEGIQQSGLAEFVGNRLHFLQNFPFILVIYLSTLAAVLFTEFTSNTAVATTLLPIMAVLVAGFSFNPLALMLAVTIGCSCAFMLPISTPPNAIVFGTHYIPIKIMVRVGFVLVLIVSVVISVYFYFII